MASHTYNPTTARSARNVESGLHDSLHHIRIHPARGGLIVEHHHLQKGIGGTHAELPTKENKRPSVESGLHMAHTTNVGPDMPTGVHSTHVFGSTEDMYDHLEHHLGQILEEHEHQHGTENEPGEEQ